jgi:seryl-tRNA synthetase
MLDIKLIREQPDAVRDALLKRNAAIDFSELLGWDDERRARLASLEAKRNQRNDVSAKVPALKKAGADVQAVFAEMKSLGNEIKVLESEVAELEQRVFDFVSGLPNLVDADVVAGGKENNQIIATWGNKPSFDFTPKDHVALLSELGMVDYARGTKLGGSGFWVYRGDGARMEWALLNFFVERHIAAGYEFVLPPHLLSMACGYTAGQFPKFVDDVFMLEGNADQERRFLLPTAETALVNLHRDELLAESDLPRKYFAYTPCYRKEAGSYRTEERGTVRGHQFNKVELFQYCRPADSSGALEAMLEHAQSLVRELGLHHQVSKLAAADVSAGMAKTFDIEVWIPSMQQYKEVSSASNARDYQARRGQIRYRPEGQKKTELVHTLNASGLATSRLLPAIVEQFQRADGTVAVPAVLVKWLGKEVLSP